MSYAELFKMKLGKSYQTISYNPVSYLDISDMSRDKTDVGKKNKTLFVKGSITTIFFWKNMKTNQGFETADLSCRRKL